LFRQRRDCDRRTLAGDEYRSQYFEGGRVLTGAISATAIDMALHDLVAKRLGVPVYQFFGGAQRELVPCFGTVGENFEGDRRGSTAVGSGSKATTLSTSSLHLGLSENASCSRPTHSSSFERHFRRGVISAGDRLQGGCYCGMRQYQRRYIHTQRGEV
jgi:L-alanine-DL-glutamate epimerase-like enolase superfamily enzyme